MKKFSIFYWVAFGLFGVGLILLLPKLFLFFYLCVTGFLISMSYAWHCLKKETKYQSRLYALLTRDRNLSLQAMTLSLGGKQISDVNEFKSQIYNLLDDIAALYKAKKITEADYEDKFASSVSFWKKFIDSHLSDSI